MGNIPEEQLDTKAQEAFEALEFHGGAIYYDLWYNNDYRNRSANRWMR